MIGASEAFASSLVLSFGVMPSKLAAVPCKAPGRMLGAPVVGRQGFGVVDEDFEELRALI